MLLLAWGCAKAENVVPDVGTDPPVDALDAGDLTADPSDALDTLPDPDAPSDTWDAADDGTPEPPMDALDPPVDTVDAVDTTDPPIDTTVELDTYDPPPDPVDTYDPPPDLTTECWPTCTDALTGAAVCPGSRGFRVCPSDPRCWEGCTCSSTGTWITCDGICLC